MEICFLISLIVALYQVQVIKILLVILTIGQLCGLKWLVMGTGRDTRVINFNFPQRFFVRKSLNTKDDTTTKKAISEF